MLEPASGEVTIGPVSGIHRLPDVVLRQRDGGQRRPIYVREQDFIHFVPQNVRDNPQEAFEREQAQQRIVPDPVVEYPGRVPDPPEEILIISDSEDNISEGFDDFFIQI